MRKFKVGDRVKIISDDNPNNKAIGSEAVIIEYDRGNRAYEYKVEYDNEETELFREKNLKKIKKPKLTEKRIREIIQEELKPTPVVLDPFWKPINWKGGYASKIGARIAFSKPKEEPKPKSGWYKNDEWSKWLMYYDFENIKVYGFDYKGLWFEETVLDPKKEDYLADPKEVEQRLIEEAKRRGHDYCNWEYNEDNGKLYGTNSCISSGWIHRLDEVILDKGKWATIIQDTVTINGYEMEQEANVVSFGCKQFSVSRIKELHEHCVVMGIESIIVKSHEVTIQELERIVKAIK